MDRKEFLRTGCIACVGLAFGAAILQSCTPTRYVKGTRTNDGMLLEMNAFDGKEGKRPYVVLKHDDLLFPVCVYHIEGNQYTAVLMSCTHQGAELQVSGDMLTCPAHGSSFDKWGNATEAPATLPLRSFPVTVTDGKLFIDMRKQA
jgi:nitrite reductase/ring-hydroxylating ferredoxin subunit